jgi:DNA-binding NarL/FixJ family response regulator
VTNLLAKLGIRARFAGETAQPTSKVPVDTGAEAGTQGLPPALPDGLSTREAEILRLVALGMTNQQIADQLFLSVRTIERHVLNAYGKIGGHGRANATAYAIHRLT